MTLISSLTEIKSRNISKKVYRTYPQNNQTHYVDFDGKDSTDKSSLPDHTITVKDSSSIKKIYINRKRNEIKEYVLTNYFMESPVPRTHPLLGNYLEYMAFFKDYGLTFSNNTFSFKTIEKKENKEIEYEWHVDTPAYSWSEKEYL